MIKNIEPDKNVECMSFMEQFKKGDTIHWYKKKSDSIEPQSFKGFLHSYDIFYTEIRFSYKLQNNQTINHRIFFYAEEDDYYKVLYNASICRLVLIEKEFKSQQKPYLGI